MTKNELKEIRDWCESILPNLRHLSIQDAEFIAKVRLNLLDEIDRLKEEIFFLQEIE